MVPKSGVGRGSHNTFGNHFQPSQTLPRPFHALSSMPGEISFRWKRTCVVKYALWNDGFQKQTERESMLCRLCQVCLVKCRFAKTSWKRTCFVKYAWWNAVLQDKLKENVFCHVCLCQTLTIMPGEMPFCKKKLKENMLCQVCLVKYRKRTCFVVCLGKCRFPKTSWRRTCFVIFVKYAWWSAVLQKQAKREHALSSMPGEMPFCKISWETTRFVKHTG